MNSNRAAIYIALVTLIIIICVPAFLTVNDRHKEKLNKSMHLQVTEAARKCVIEEKCTKDKIFIKELYDNKYLASVINPNTQEKLNINSYVEKKKDGYQLIVVE